MPHSENQRDLILKFNTFKSYQHRIKTKKTGNKAKENGEFVQLPWDMLDIICKALDFEDLLSFSGVCKSWRTFHKTNFLSSQEPLLVRFMIRNGSESYSFISIPNEKVYDLKMMTSFPRPKFTYVRVSSGYFIMACENNSFMLFNSFTRIKKVIQTPFPVDSHLFAQYEALLAFEKCSQEYVLVVLSYRFSCLYVYQTRHNGWVIYPTFKSEEVVVDFVVLNNIIYVVTNNANIGILNLNSGNIQFLNLKNTPPPKVPSRVPSNSFKLVNCDDQLLLFHSISSFQREVYKIDFSTMNYVEMDSLGDIALFYVSWRNCRALSNPERFGYQSNHVYEVNNLSQCTKFDWNDGFCPSKIYPYLGSRRDFNFFDWCFRHVKYQVDYSLVE
ncbi:F-box protein At3g56470-like [Vicia villosa]|uniref:F-box protein At3g56470-like n=1 Tax=Vicia villosa TaxID=3911 RepID=UPI00273B9936|nr:F-box protein At3g56470-like [Vicia villosa]